jgi:uncharacterized membrane protein YfcA
MRSGSKSVSLVPTRPCRTHDNETHIQELSLLSLSPAEVTYCFIVIVFAYDVWLLLAITLPMTLIGIYLGNRIFAEVSEVRFRWLVSLTLMVSGFALLVK